MRYLLDVSSLIAYGFRRMAFMTGLARGFDPE